MPTINKLPIGGGGASEVGISDGKGIVNLNVFTQMNEPAKKDGIWIKTNHTYQRIMLNQPYVVNSASGVWQVSDTPPDDFFQSAYTLYNGLLYVFMGNNIYTYNGSSWVNHGRIDAPANNDTFNRGAAVSYNGYIYLFSTIYDNVYNNTVYRYDGSIFTYISTLTISEFNGSYSAHVVYNNKIHIFGDDGEYGYYEHYTFNGSTFTKMNSIKINGDFVRIKNGVLYNGEIWAFGQVTTDNTNNLCWYVYNDDTGWREEGSAFPLSVHNVTTIDLVVYNNEIHYLTSMHGFYSFHYKWNGHTWTYIGNMDMGNVNFNCRCMPKFVFNGTLHAIGYSDKGSVPHPKYNYQFQAPNKVYSPNTLILYKGNQHNGKYLTAIADTSAIIDDGKNNNRFISGFDDAVYFADSSFDWTAPMYYGDGTQWIKFKN